MAKISPEQAIAALEKYEAENLGDISPTLDIFTKWLESDNGAFERYVNGNQNSRPNQDIEDFKAAAASATSLSSTSMGSGSNPIIQYAISGFYPNDVELRDNAVIDEHLDYYLQFFDSNSQKLCSKMSNKEKTEFIRRVSEIYNLQSLDSEFLEHISTYQLMQAQVVFLEGINNAIKAALEQHGTKSGQQAKEILSKNKEFIAKLDKKNNEKWKRIENYQSFNVAGSVASGEEFENDLGEMGTGMKIDSSNQGRPKRAVEQRRLDQLAWLLEGNTTCAAIAEINGKFYISTNKFFSNTQLHRNEQLDNVNAIINYFWQFANSQISGTSGKKNKENVMTRGRNEIVKSICKQRVSASQGTIRIPDNIIEIVIQNISSSVSGDWSRVLKKMKTQ